MFNYLRALVASAAIVSVSAAEAITLDFDNDAGGNPIVAGQIIDNEYAGFGVSISTVNLGGGPNLGVAFDSMNPPPASDDGDLITPGFGFNNNEAFKNVLIIQEHGGDGNNDGFLDGVTDDESGGGFIDFLFTSNQLFADVDLIDIEEGGGTVQLFLNGGLQSTQAIANLGNNSHQNISINGIAFDQLRVNLVGSGAIAEVTTVGVPEPSTWLFMGTALAGVMLATHRRRVRV